ncbi:MAG: FHA domain-containing protein [Lachnospiraceae bacterium]|nr:FHA domain-containing protein [Lachnospiraceae bacterium]
MSIGMKTLILIDNSASVSAGNRAIVKETLKYLITHAPEENDFALATFTGQTELLVDYGSETNAYLDAVDKISYVEKNASLPDVIMHTLTEWHDADFAMRSILVFTDGLSNASETYPVEELYFRLNESGYPLYIVGLCSGENAVALKNAAAMARIAHGGYFPTEFENSDAEVEKKLTEQLLAAMEKYTRQEGGKNEEEQETEKSTGHDPYEAVDTEDYELRENYLQYEEEVSPESLTQKEHGVVLFGAMGAGIMAVVLMLLLLIRHLSGKHTEEVNGRRPVVHPKGRCITLEDLNDPVRFFRIPEANRIVIGADRSQSDVAIENDEDVSLRHCVISRFDERYYVRDLQSAYGTFVNGERIDGETEIHSGDVIKVGRAKLMMRVMAQ